jgi:hypothetical protein
MRKPGACVDEAEREAEEQKGGDAEGDEKEHWTDRNCERDEEHRHADEAHAAIEEDFVRAGRAAPGCA